MKWIKRLLILLMFLGIACFAIILFLPYLNDYQKDGVLTLKGLKNGVTVKRDEKGMAYIYAENLHDAIMGPRVCDRAGSIVSDAIEPTFYGGTDL